MRLKEFLLKYLFHIFALLVFLLVSLYKFFPGLFLFPKTPVIDVVEEKSPDLTTPIHVDLSGAILFPGVYEMLPTARVGDLISKGGGFSQNASVLWISRNINLSKLLYDTQKIYVPYEWETYGDCTCLIDSLYLEVPLSKPIDNSNKSTDQDQKASVDNDNKTNINTATLDELDALSGIGPAYAKKILDNKPYSDLDDFISKSGIPENTINKISSQITF